MLKCYFVLRWSENIGPTPSKLNTYEYIMEKKLASYLIKDLQIYPVYVSIAMKESESITFRLFSEMGPWSETLDEKLCYLC